MLHDACAQTSNTDAWLRIDDLSITNDPIGGKSKNHFLDVLAPIPDSEYNRATWETQLCRWELRTPPPTTASSKVSRYIGAPVNTSYRGRDRKPPQPQQLKPGATNRLGRTPYRRTTQQHHIRSNRTLRRLTWMTSAERVLKRATYA